MRMTLGHVDALTLNYAGVHVFQSTFIDRVGFIGAFYFYFFFFLFLSLCFFITSHVPRHVLRCDCSLFRSVRPSDMCAFVFSK